ncbi:unnamed protein product [Sympodiomycopsis kandeliae]
MATSSSSTAAATARSPSSLAAAIAVQPNEKLTYSISAASSFSSGYRPELILEDRPHDLSSRWSGASYLSTAGNSSPAPSGTSSPAPITPAIIGTSSPSSSSSSRRPSKPGSSKMVSTTSASSKQYIILKLDSPAIVRCIYFGKHQNPHPCNLRDFKVYGGNSADPHAGRWLRLLRAGLKNNSTGEEFTFRWDTPDGIPIPLQYIMIIPLATHSHNYNFSIWHVALRGCTDRLLVKQASQHYQDFCEGNTIRLILKHLRAKGHHSAFRELLRSSQMQPEDIEAATSSTSLAHATTSESFRHLQRPFEHPVITRLFQAVLRGDYDTAEQCLEQAAGVESSGDDDGNDHDETNDTIGQPGGDASSSKSDLLASYVTRCSQHAQWTRIYATDADGQIPSPRGGHHMVVDSKNQIAYLFGGWDGTHELNDLWMYYIAESRWRCVSKDTTLQGGPSPRSCHKMAFDSRSGLIYVLGRYVSSETQIQSGGSDGTQNSTLSLSGSSGASTPQSRMPGNLPSSSPRTRPESAASSHNNPTGETSSPSHTSTPASQPGATLHPASAATARGGATSTSPAPGTPIWLYASDFYRFSTRSERWDRLSMDTHIDGGPKLMYDPDMVVDEQNQMLYVFGGRIAHWDPKYLEYSGMWRYDCIQRSWTFLFDDTSSADTPSVPGRSGHVMLFDKNGAAEGNRGGQLWILGGQRETQYLADMHVYNVVSNEVREVHRDYEANAGGPEGGFTQRAVIDAGKREIYLFSGLTQRNGGSQRTAFWVYSIPRDKWTLIWKSRGEALETSTSNAIARDEEEAGDAEESPNVVRGSGNGEDNVQPEQEDEVMTEATSNPASGTQTPRWGGPGKRKRSHLDTEPIPRFASSIVYNPRSEEFLLFGGNPTAANANGSKRLDDLWSLSLHRPQVSTILRRGKFILRQQRFKEMAATVPRPSSRELAGGDVQGSEIFSPPASSVATDASGMLAMEALIYLQTEVAAVVDHSSPRESRTFRRLVAGLLHGDGEEDEDKNGDDAATGETDDGSLEYENFSLGKESLKIVSPLLTNHSTSLHRRLESDGLPSMHSASASDDGGDSPQTSSHGEMLSISQTLPRLPLSDGSNTLDLNKISSPAIQSDKKLSALWTQRIELFKTLLQFFSTEHTEPRDELRDIVASHFARSNGGGGYARQVRR